MNLEQVRQRRSEIERVALQRGAYMPHAGEIELFVTLGMV